MATNILMPALSPTMESGTLARWHVKQGDHVEAGDLLAEIETDKAVMEFEAVDPGVIGKLLVAEATQDVQVNTPIAILLEADESMSETPEPAPGPATTGPAAPASETPTAPVSIPGATAPAAMPPTGGRVFASPLARRLAAEKNIDLASVSGSGPHGRIVKSDIAAVPASGPSAPPQTAARTDIAALFAGREFLEVPLDGMRRTVAARLTEAKQTIPHYYLRRSVEIDKLLHLREGVNAELAKQNAKLSINDFIIRASALALQNVPEANAAWAGDRILQLKPSDVAVAVAVEGGLFTPVLRNAESKTVLQLSREMKALAIRARERKLKPEDYTGGTFTISNLGMFGISGFDAVINPPHGSILAVGAAQRMAVETGDGGITFATVLELSLSCDHRVLDGALGARFLAAIADVLENPVSMLI
ncbi:MAG: pyruvate dehydrogenase complex dihydrolipoamide acetyltransferase [Rhodobacteraceae bacterium]|nr:pyruvate dehydrogenase complex dihydrolipoamide acetyltransferase [Paracoccaceae bacterium]